ncbi:MAG: Fic family protein [Patescibacteria group bacterium]|nr:Fic family protein [Patescibacteria group bacterium]
MKNRVDFLAKFIYESELLDNRCCSYNTIKSEIEQNKKDGHVGAILYLEKRTNEKDIPLTEFDIKKTHELIFKESEIWLNKTNEGWAGNYRQGKVLIGELGGVSPEIIPKKMDELIKVLNKHQILFRCKNKKISSLDTKIEFISSFHYHFGLINPFYNCNCRVNRALLFYLINYFQIQPFFVSHTEKADYFGAFISKDPQLLYEFFLKKINEQKEPD